MKSRSYENPYGDDKVCDACGLFGIMDVSGDCFPSKHIVRAINNMEERGNGLGSGFAVYGCYPEHADCYAYHVMYTEPASRAQVERFLSESFKLVGAEEVPHQHVPGLSDPPVIWRYFLRVGSSGEVLAPADEADYVVDRVMEVNTAGQGAYIYASGKNLGVFKGVGHPAQIAEYFGLEEYTGYIWTAHTRFPTNTPGWWGGAHPFGLLDWTVVHNGEISSYGTNRRFLEMEGYHCTMSTDTEVIAYCADFLMRRHGLPVEVAAKVMAPALWTEIERMAAREGELARTLRQVYGSLLVNGPFTVIIARQGEMVGLTDRIRLRPLTAAVAGDRLYLSSEEAPIRLVCPELDRVWTPVGGEPIVARLGVPPGGREAATLQGARMEPIVPSYASSG
jgi:glutamate synthase domain-containing protein 1